jgi:dihydropyrimidinase
LPRRLLLSLATQIKAPAGAKVIDATGKLVMPGGIETHSHLEMPFMGTVACDDFFSGQVAAVAGGTTMHIDFALPVGHDIDAGFALWKVGCHARASRPSCTDVPGELSLSRAPIGRPQANAQKSCIDYGFHMAITRWDQAASDAMGRLVAAGVNSFKVR